MTPTIAPHYYYYITIIIIIIIISLLQYQQYYYQIRIVVAVVISPFILFLMSNKIKSKTQFNLQFTIQLAVNSNAATWKNYICMLRPCIHNNQQRFATGETSKAKLYGIILKL